MSASYSLRQLLLAAMSFAVGIAALWHTQLHVIGPAMKPVVEACLAEAPSLPVPVAKLFVVGMQQVGATTASGEEGTVVEDEQRASDGGDAESESSQEEAAVVLLHPYEPALGGPMSCIMTQFFYELQQRYPSGLLSWLSFLTLLLPAQILVVAHAGKLSSKSGGGGGFVRWPSLILLLGQFVGLSVVFALLWVPSYVLFADTSTKKGCVSLKRSRYCFLQLLTSLVLTARVFTLDPTEHAWSVSAALLGGPLLAFAPAVGLWDDAASSAKKTASSGSKFDGRGMYGVVKAYSIAGVVSFCGYAGIVFLAFSKYGLEYQTLLSDLWGSNYAVTFMMIDAAVLFGGLFLYLMYASSKWTQLLEIVVMTPVFGPGAACSMILAQLEMEQGAQQSIAATSEAKKKTN